MFSAQAFFRQRARCFDRRRVTQAGGRDALAVGVGSRTRPGRGSATGNFKD